MTLNHRAAFVPLSSLLGLSLIIAAPMAAQQAQQPAASAAQTPAVQAPTTPAPAAAAQTPTPAPHQSALYANDDAGAPTIAAAQKDHETAMRSRNHTITYSTTILILVVIILVLLIA